MQIEMELEEEQSLPKENFKQLLKGQEIKANDLVKITHQSNNSMTTEEAKEDEKKKEDTNRLQELAKLEEAQ